MVHAVDSKSTGGNTLGVRVPPPAPDSKARFTVLFLFFVANTEFISIFSNVRYALSEVFVVRNDLCLHSNNTLFRAYATQNATQVSEQRLKKGVDFFIYFLTFRAERVLINILQGR